MAGSHLIPMSTTSLYQENELMSLRIDKGSRAVRCVIVRSGGTILSTVILEISPESSYFSPSYDIEYNIFGLELWKLRI